MLHIMLFLWLVYPSVSIHILVDISIDMQYIYIDTHTYRIYLHPCDDNHRGNLSGCSVYTVCIELPHFHGIGTAKILDSVFKYLTTAANNLFIFIFLG